MLCAALPEFSSKQASEEQEHQGQSFELSRLADDQFWNSQGGTFGGLGCCVAFLSLRLSDHVFSHDVELDCGVPDRYGREVCVVLRGGQDVNLEQVRAGLAGRYRQYSKAQSVERRESYAAAERETQGREEWLNTIVPIATINPLALNRDAQPRQRASRTRRSRSLD